MNRPPDLGLLKALKVFITLGMNLFPRRSKDTAPAACKNVQVPGKLPDEYGLFVK